MQGGFAVPVDGGIPDRPLRDACGVFGVFAPEHDVARLVYFGLYALQHRGQESAGIAVSDEGQVTVIKDLGLVSQVFDERMLTSLSGQHAIGHVRYSTTGAPHWQNSQPLVRSRNGDVVALGHNGNLVNTTELRDDLVRQGVKFSGTTDTEVITALIAHEAQTDLLEAVRTAVSKIRGAFSATVLSGDSLVGFRDPYGVRPLVLGTLDGHPVISSETAALDILGATFAREIAPGEIVIVDAEHGLRSERVALEGARPALCIFEFIYFARPDSTMAGRNLHEARQAMGRQLALEAPVDADLVIPVPDTGIPAAIGYSSASGIPYTEGLIKNRYVYRTFIQPDDDLRQRGIHMKLNPLTSVIRGKRLVVVDDSIVRGNTTTKLVEMLFAAGAEEVHLRVSSPPIKWPCFYGIDMATRAELIAANMSVDEIRRKVGATTLHYLTLDGLQASTGLPETQFCRACFTGDYPIAVPEEYAMCKMRFENDAACEP
ncbi:MAG TPA: amidophosphoribosyltransferase [Thermoleophilia bacterium]|nr:amidophosphoribosyltransferase [Thermoleophilia bacterium]HQG04614.1 amidophosphoribosyltransferase [Thermoleophilia bacterium]HQG54233.1 amidophosphoribosyltransferase [Thermoleophilia bacterium]HQJ97869.1 amidophosphoribosyltransferase [Thermoleophilia bacterium]